MLLWRQAVDTWLNIQFLGDLKGFKDLDLCKICHHSRFGPCGSGTLKENNFWLHFLFTFQWNKRIIAIKNPLSQVKTCVELTPSSVEGSVSGTQCVLGLILFMLYCTIPTFFWLLGNNRATRQSKHDPGFTGRQPRGKTKKSGGGGECEIFMKAPWGDNKERREGYKRLN